MEINILARSNSTKPYREHEKFAHYFRPMGLKEKIMHLSEPPAMTSRARIDDSPVVFPEEMAPFLLKTKMAAVGNIKTDVLQGTLALMVLKTLGVPGPQLGYGIARRIEQAAYSVSERWTASFRKCHKTSCFFPSLLVHRRPGHSRNERLSDCGAGNR
jgi:hypothetical protein